MAKKCDCLSAASSDKQLIAFDSSDKPLMNDDVIIVWTNQHKYPNNHDNGYWMSNSQLGKLNPENDEPVNSL